MTSPKEVEVATDLAVRRYIARYCQLVDDGDYAAAADLFADDGRLRVDGADLHGRPAIKEWLERRKGGQSHSVTNVVVSNGSRPGTAHAVSDLALRVRADDGTWSEPVIGRYHDTFAGSGRDMRFTQRILTLRQ